jgi:hypothetical protein
LVGDRKMARGNYIDGGVFKIEDWRKIKWMRCRDGCYVWSKIIRRELVGVSFFFFERQNILYIRGINPKYYTKRKRNTFSPTGGARGTPQRT